MTRSTVRPAVLNTLLSGLLVPMTPRAEPVPTPPSLSVTVTRTTSGPVVAGGLNVKLAAVPDWSRLPFWLSVQAKVNVSSEPGSVTAEVRLITSGLLFDPWTLTTLTFGATFTTFRAAAALPDSPSLSATVSAIAYGALPDRLSL